MARYGLSHWIGSQPGKFPLAIFLCNIIGCFLIGWIYGWSKTAQPNWLSPLAITGFLGGFTTFSTFTLDTQKLLQAQLPILGISYILASVLGGLCASYLGYRIGKVT